jgi:hypothetical protein
MEKIIGRIEKKAEAKAKNGVSYWAYTINGKNYNSFNPIFNDKFQIGEIVEISLEQNGKYLNMTDMVSSTEKVQSQACNEQIETSKHDVVINRTERPHSIEWGASTLRHKIYYENEEDGNAQIVTALKFDKLIMAPLEQ